jgi:hypothetical protein
VAYFMPPDWARIARHLVPALERASGDEPAVRLLVLVPDSGAALALTRALSETEAAQGRRLVAGTSPARLQRLLGAGPADVVIGSPDAIAAALGASAIKLSELKTVVFAAADEMDHEADALATVLAEVPKEAARMMTAVAATPGVEMLIERYLPKVRRVVEDVTPAEGASPAPQVRYLTVHGSQVEVLPALLDELDAPSATILVSDEHTADDARALLTAVGYPEGTLAQVTTGAVPANVALVVVLGVPTATLWQAAVDATPTQLVVILAPRDVEALRMLCGESEPRPLADRAAISRARSQEARRRAELRAELAEGIPSREVLALEPLLHENDGLEIAAAALRLLEKTRAVHQEQVMAAESRVRSQMREAQKEKEALEKEEGRESAPRLFKPRGDGPRSFGDKPRGSFGDKPRGDGPRSFGDKPRGSFGDKPRGGFGRDRDDKPRGGFGRDRDDKPRGDGPRSFARDGDEKPRVSSFHKDRDDKPRSGGFSRDAKPRTGGFKRDDKPRTGGFKRDDKPRGPRPPRGDR